MPVDTPFLQILIIEDDPGDYGLVALALQKIQMAGGLAPGVRWATNLAEGIALADVVNPDLVLLDLNLPDSGRLSSLTTLLDALPGLPVIVLTGHDDEHLAMAALDNGAQDYLVKGQFDAAMLARAVRYALARSRLEARTQLFQAALEASAESILISDIEGRIQWCNPAFEKMTGYSAAEATGRTPGELLKSGQSDAAFYQQMWETILAGRVWRGELVNRDKNGRFYDQMLSIAPVLGRSGVLCNFVAVMYDITDRKRLMLDGTDLLRKIEGLIQRVSRLDEDKREETLPAPASSKLSARQREILDLVTQGMTSTEIAQQLQISPATVVTHRRDLMRKLNVRSVAQLARHALENSLLGKPR
jgi:PAS domain S-box-containing protein